MTFLFWMNLVKVIKLWCYGLVCCLGFYYFYQLLILGLKRAMFDALYQGSDTHLKIVKIVQFFQFFSLKHCENCTIFTILQFFSYKNWKIVQFLQFFGLKKLEKLYNF